jgi:ribose transport system permease protein
MTLAMMQIGAGICALLVRGQIAYAVPPIMTLGSVARGRALDRHRARGLPAGPRPCRADLYPLRPLRLHGGRQPRGGGIFRRQRQADRRRGHGDLGGLRGVAGMLGVAHFGSAQQNEFDSYLLDSIAAVVVGGTSLFGGRGGIGNTIVGLFVLGVLNNGLDHVQIDSFLKILIRGLILLIALIINVYAQRLGPDLSRP